MQLERIDHVALNVTDLDVSLGWYEKVFGFTIVHKWTTTWMIGLGPIRLGLFSRPKAKPVDDLDQAIAFTHVAFLTDEAGFQAAQEKFRSLEIPFDPVEDTTIAYSVFVNDPDGHQIEVTTYYKDAPPAEGELQETPGQEHCQ
jgi:catechol 2,3-dioxygenase-like lactoylglutathione lyase family enzyme